MARQAGTNLSLLLLLLLHTHASTLPPPRPPPLPPPPLPAALTSFRGLNIEVLVDTTLEVFVADASSDWAARAEDFCRRHKLLELSPACPRRLLESAVGAASDAWDPWQATLRAVEAAPCGAPGLAELRALLAPLGARARRTMLEHATRERPLFRLARRGPGARAFLGAGPASPLPSPPSPCLVDAIQSEDIGCGGAASHGALAALLRGRQSQTKATLIDRLEKVALAWPHCIAVRTALAEVRLDGVGDAEAASRDIATALQLAPCTCAGRLPPPSQTQAPTPARLAWLLMARIDATLGMAAPTGAGPGSRKTPAAPNAACQPGLQLGKKLLERLQAFYLRCRCAEEVAAVAEHLDAAMCVDAKGRTIGFSSCGSITRRSDVDAFDAHVEAWRRRLETRRLSNGSRKESSEKECDVKATRESPASDADRDTTTCRVPVSEPGLSRLLSAARQCPTADMRHVYSGIRTSSSVEDVERVLEEAVLERLRHGHGEPLLIRGGARHWPLVQHVLRSQSRKGNGRTHAEFVPWLKRTLGKRAVQLSVSPDGQFDTLEPASLWRTDSADGEDEDGAEEEVLALPAQQCGSLASLLHLLRPRASPASSSSDRCGAAGSPSSSKMMEGKDEQEAKLGSIRFYLQYYDLAQLGAESNVACPEPTFARRLELADANVWLGDGCTAGKLHFDRFDNLLGQVAGSKLFLLFHPLEARHLGHARANHRMAWLDYSWPSTFRRTLGESPGGKGASKTFGDFAPANVTSPGSGSAFAARFGIGKDRRHRGEQGEEEEEQGPGGPGLVGCRVEPGDLLLVPAFWWHEVISRPHSADDDEAGQTSAPHAGTGTMETRLRINEHRDEFWSHAEATRAAADFAGANRFLPLRGEDGDDDNDNDMLLNFAANFWFRPARDDDTIVCTQDGSGDDILRAGRHDALSGPQCVLRAFQCAREKAAVVTTVVVGDGAEWGNSSSSSGGTEPWQSEFSPTRLDCAEAPALF